MGFQRNQAASATLIQSHQSGLLNEIRAEIDCKFHQEHLQNLTRNTCRFHQEPFHWRTTDSITVQLPSLPLLSYYAAALLQHYTTIAPSALLTIALLFYCACVLLPFSASSPRYYLYCTTVLLYFCPIKLLPPVVSHPRYTTSLMYYCSIVLLSC